MRISDWSSDVCSSDLIAALLGDPRRRVHVVGGRFTDALARYLSVQLRILRSGVNHLQDQEANWVDQVLDFGKRDVLDRKRVVQGKSVSVSVDLDGRRINKKNSTRKYK